MKLMNQNPPRRFMQGCCFWLALCLWSSCKVHGQGTFAFYNGGAPTLLYNGQTAGPGIWGQALVGLTNDSLTPMGCPSPHRVGGLIYPEPIYPPFPGGTYVQAQMAVWDGTIWGVSSPTFQPASLVSQISCQCSSSGQPSQTTSTQHFTQAAVVPLVPEPSVAVFSLVGGALCWGRVRRRRS
jgi:hypothetical protein